MIFGEDPMTYLDCLPAAIDAVLTWDEFPDELLSDAVASRAALLAGGTPDDDSALSMSDTAH